MTPDAAESDAQAGLAALTDELRQALAPGLQLLKQLGEGGMGTVFLARDPALKRTVVVKVLSPALANDEVARRRFEREAEAAAAVSHSNVVSIYQVGELPESGTSYFVMQHVDGQTLADAFPSGTTVPQARAKRIIGEIASALAAAHANGLVHRDIKPSNIMLEAHSDRVIVLDFGISAAAHRGRAPDDARLTATGASIGTPQYMSPEQAAGEEVTGKSDLYSLGLVAFELLTGRPPFEEKNPMALIAAHINREPPTVTSLRSDVDPLLASLIDRCLAKSGDARPTAQDVAATLLGTRRQVIEWPPPGLEPLQGRTAAALRAMVFAALAGILIAVALLLQPVSASARWHEGESGLWRPLAQALNPPTPRGPDGSSQVVGAAGEASQTDPTPVWLFLVGIAAAGWVAAMTYTGTTLARLAACAVRSRAAGYPGRALVTAAFNRRRDTGELFNGTGSFGLVHAETRGRIARLRTGRSLVLVAGLAWAAVLPISALWGVAGSTGNADTLIARSEVLFMVTPLLAMAAAVLGGWLAERSISGRRAAPRQWWREPELPPRSVVAGWLSATGEQPAGAGWAGGAVLARRAITWLVVVVLAGGVLAVGVTAMIGLVVAGLATGSLRQGHGAAVAWLADTTAARRFQRAESLLAAAGIPASTDSPATGAARSLLARRWDSPFGMSTDFLRFTTTWEGMGARQRDSVAALLLGAPIPPEVLLFRSVAAGAALPESWFVADSRVRGRRTSTLFQAAGMYWLIWDHVARANAALGLASLRQGDRAAATLRARENLAVAQRLGPAPELYWWRRSAGREGVLLLQRIGVSGGDPVLRSQARDLDEALQTVSTERMRQQQAFEALWGQPSSSPLLALIGDTALPRSMRLMALHGIVFGVCFNPREALFGVDPHRRELLNRGGTMLGRGAGDSGLVAAYQSELDLLNSESARALNNIGAGHPVWARLPQPPWLKAPGTRVLLCRFAHQGFI